MATPEQLKIARSYGIKNPETIDVEKCYAYFKCKNTPEGKLDRFLDRLNEKHCRRLVDDCMKGLPCGVEKEERH